MRHEKDARASKCIYEFRGEGKCKNGDQCSFSHEITENDRNSETMKQSINDKLEIMKKKKEIAVTKSSSTEADQSPERVYKEIVSLRQEFLLIKEMIGSRNP